MHILKIIHGYPPEYNAGSEVYSKLIVNQLSKTNKITVFTREENEYQADFNFRYDTFENINFVYVNMPRAKDGYNHQLLNQNFEHLLMQIKPDIAHIGHLNHLSTGIIDELNKAKIPIIFTLHDFWLMCPRGQFLQRNFDGQNIYQLCDFQEDSKCALNCYKMYFSDSEGQKYYTNWVKKRMQITKNIIDKVDLFIAPSKYLMKRFISDFKMPNHKIIYLDYGFSTEYLSKVDYKNHEIFTFGYIGTHISAKGINILIEAFAKLKAQAKLLIFGRQQGQNTAALKKIAAKTNNIIEFCGEYKNENIKTFVFQNVDCIVVPSIWAENSPLVIHEAQACKVPVITANFGGMKEYVKHQVNGLLFEHRNVESLHKQMNFAINNPKKLKELGEKAYLFSDDGKIIDIKEHCIILDNIYKNLLLNKND